MTEKVHSPRIQRKRQKKFNQLLDEAMKLIIATGFSSLTMRTLAKSMDMTPGALYRYFSSKGHIIGALGNRTLETYAKVIQKGVAKIEETHKETSDRIRSLLIVGVIGQEYMRLSLQSYENYRILNMIMTNETRYMTNPPDYSSFMQGSLNLLQFTASKYEIATQNNAIEDGDHFLRALSFLSILNGTLQMKKFGEELPVLIHLHKIYTSVFRSHLRGIGATVEDVDIIMNILYKDI